jgi:hypothetical protein
MEIKKEETVNIIGKNYKGIDGPIRMRVHWNMEQGQYVLCKRFFGIGWVHFTIEECEDMIQILKRFNQDVLDLPDKYVSLKDICKENGIKHYDNPNEARNWLKDKWRKE